MRSVWAVLAGIATLTVSSFAIEALTNPLLVWMFPGALPNTAAISFHPLAAVFMLVYGIVCVAAGGYVTAWVARFAPVRHAIVMGVIQTGLTAMAMYDFRDRAPLRNWILSMLITLPSAWMGGLIRVRRRRVGVELR